MICEQQIFAWLYTYEHTSNSGYADENRWQLMAHYIGEGKKYKNLHNPSSNTSTQDHKSFTVFKS